MAKWGRQENGQKPAEARHLDEVDYPFPFFFFSKLSLETQFIIKLEIFYCAAVRSLDRSSELPLRRSDANLFMAFPCRSASIQMWTSNGWIIGHSNERANWTFDEEWAQIEVMFHWIGIINKQDLTQLYPVSIRVKFALKASIINLLLFCCWTCG